MDTCRLKDLRFQSAISDMYRVFLPQLHQMAFGCIPKEHMHTKSRSESRGA